MSKHFNKTNGEQIIKVSNQNFGIEIFTKLNVHINFIMRYIHIFREDYENYAYNL